jgi:uncharacterized protein (DUF58 family)
MTPSRRIRFVWTKEFAVWLGLVVLIGVVGWMKTINLLSLISYLLLALLVVNVCMAWRMLMKITATRTPPPPKFAGETSALVGTITNRSADRAVVSVREAKRDFPRTWFVSSLPGGESIEFTGPIQFTTRGRYPVTALEAASGYPFGLVQLTRPLITDGEVVVLPRLGQVDVPAFRRWLIRTTATADNSRRAFRRAAPADGEVRGLRTYRPGDSPREVHWRTSARRDQLMVREYDRSPPLNLMIVVDPWVPSVPTDRFSKGKLEWALSLAVSVAWGWVHADQSGHLTLLVGGTEWTIRDGPGTPSFVRTGFAPLADVTGCPSVPPIPPALFRGSERSLRLVVSTRANSPISGELRAAGLSVAQVEPGVQPIWFVPSRTPEAVAN